MRGDARRKRPDDGGGGDADGAKRGGDGGGFDGGGGDDGGSEGVKRRRWKKGKRSVRILHCALPASWCAARRFSVLKSVYIRTPPSHSDVEGAVGAVCR